MTRRRLTLALFALVPLGLLALFPAGVFKEPAPAATPRFALLGEPTLPFVPKNTFINSSWFCGGVPNNENDRGGDVRVVNPGDAPLQGHLTVFSDAPDAKVAERSFEVPGRGVWTAVLDEVQPTGTYLSALVEIAGGGGFVEQRAVAKSGTAVSPCSNSTSTNWYFADNYTLNGSSEDLVITNPFPDDAILDFTFASNNGTRTPQALQGLPVKGNSIVVVTEANMPKDEAVLAVTVAASRGRVVVARAQHYLGERGGYSLTLGSPSLSSEWWFADGEVSPDVAFERYSIYNPSDSDVTVTTNVWGLNDQTDFVGMRTDTIAAGNVLSFTTADFEGMPKGRHGMTFSTESNRGVVIERGITRKAGSGFVTSVVMGAPAVFNGYTRWSMAVGPDVAVDDVLVVMNLDFLDGTVTVKSRKSRFITTRTSSTATSTMFWW